MARFQAKSSNDGTKKLLLSLIIFFLILFLFLEAISGLSKTSVDRQYEQLEQALMNGITYSYVTYGYYPESLEQLTSEYKIRYDEKLFFVDYRVLGGNLFPEVTILRKEETK